jgi:hypothetical protein
MSMHNLPKELPALAGFNGLKQSAWDYGPAGYLVQVT